MVAHSFSPGRISLFVLTHHPGTAGTIQQILRTEDVGDQKQLRVFDTAVYMAFGGEVHDIVETVFGKKAVHHFAAANVSFDKETTFVVDIFGNSSQITRIRQGVKNHHFYIAVLGQDILNIIGANKSCGTGHQISFHI